MNDHPDNQIAQCDHGIPHRTALEMNRACTVWLRDRGLLASQESEVLAAAQSNCAKRRRRLSQPK